MVRGIRNSALEQMPQLASIIDTLMPKKGNVYLVKCKDHVSLVVANNEILFIQVRDGQIAPTLRLIHKYPTLLAHHQVDTGAIKYVLAGANVMCPGLTSPGGRLAEGLPAGRIVAVMAENKQHALAVALTQLSTDDIRKTSKGVALEAVHYLNDGLWNFKVGDLNLR